MNTPAASAPHIFTLTGNLLAERTLEFAAWSPGRTQRATRETFQVGGKGINVTRMLTRLGTANTALCFTGGAPGAECEAWLHARRLAFRAFATSAPTRVGTVVRAGPQPETTFLGPDVAPDPAAIQECAAFLDAQLPDQILALCGSFPGWPDPAFEPLRQALEHWRARGLLVADTYGPPLKWLMGQPLELMKLNAAELKTAGFGPVDQLPPEPRRWIVTDGPRAVRVRDTGGPEFSVVPPAVSEVSPTGSGDVLLACVLRALFHQGNSLADAVRFALPYAAANAAHPGIAEFPTPIPSRS